MTPELSICIPTMDVLSERVKECISSIRETTSDYEIIVVENSDPPQGVTAPINASLRAARGRYMVVCNDDVMVLPGWWEPLRRVMDAGAWVVFPTTVKGEMRFDFAAWCFGMTSEFYEKFGVEEGEFLDPELKIFYQDVDLMMRMKQVGRSPVWVQDSEITHGGSSSILDDDSRAWVKDQIDQDRDLYIEKMERRTGLQAFHGTSA